MLEACIAQGIEESHEADLQELLIAALQLSEETGADLASALRMLCRLAAASADQSAHAQHLAQQVCLSILSSCDCADTHECSLMLLISTRRSSLLTRSSCNDRHECTAITA